MAKQPLIEQIVGTFRPTIQAQTEALPTALPTPASEAAGVVGPGTHLVGIDIAPGVYVGLPPEGVLCTWERLNSLREVSESINAVDAHVGLYYVEVLESDLALATTCELSPIEDVPARAELLNSVPAGMYMVGRDIASGSVQRGSNGKFVLHLEATERFGRRSCQCHVERDARRTILRRCHRIRLRRSIRLSCCKSGVAGSI